MESEHGPSGRRSGSARMASWTKRGIVACAPVPAPPPLAPPPRAPPPGPSGSLAQAARYLDIDRAADRGLDGTGVRAAVIDSGVDFTHGDLGGPGTAAAYTACYGTPPGAGVSEAGQPRNAAPTGDCA